MAAKVKHIDLANAFAVPIIIGAPEILVKLREQRGQYVTKGGQGYCTNREIKIWATWFLLKSLTSSGVIQNWYNQRVHLLQFLQMNENTFRRQLYAMETLQLIHSTHSSRKPWENDADITLCSYKQAAAVLGIKYSGQTTVTYNPSIHSGKQIFQYILRTQELQDAQDTQLATLMYKMNKNPAYRDNMIVLLVKSGADKDRLGKDPGYFQTQLLNLQLQMFKAGSDIFQYVNANRADINRGVIKIQVDHTYKSPSSVSYMKRRMRELRLIRITKVSVKSFTRTRLYVPNGEGGTRDGYKWIDKPCRFGKNKNAGYTVLFLCDQIEIVNTPTKENEAKKVSIAA
jgi:hypothetical protein